MKKDGIQTRNRKMSTKSKKKGKGMSSMCDLLKPMDKPFGGFPHNLSPTMHAPVPTYMTSGSSLGGSFMPSGGHMQGAPGLGHHGGFAGGFGSQFPSSLPSSFSSSFSSIPSINSGLNLSTTSNMVGAAMA